jgi:hypothetical protein
MSTEKALINKHYLLERFPGKGGWTYARIPEVLQDKHAHFGWVRVRGSIDSVEIKGYHLMPMGNGQLFLPVKAAIRKKISKHEGDSVHIVLFADSLPNEMPTELKEILEEEPNAYSRFLKYSLGEQKAMIEWIYAAKKEVTKAERIAELLNKLELD